MIRLSTWSLAAFALALVFGVASSAVAMHTAKVSIKSIDADKNQIVVTDAEGKDWTYKLEDGAKIYCQKGKAGRISDLKERSEVWVLGDKRDSGYCATALLVREGLYKNAGISFGTLKSVRDDQLVITDSKGKDWNYHLSDTAGIELNNKAAKASELRKGDETTIVFDKQGDRYTILDLCSKRK